MQGRIESEYYATLNNGVSLHLDNLEMNPRSLYCQLLNFLKLTLTASRKQGDRTGKIPGACPHPPPPLFLILILSYLLLSSTQKTINIMTPHCYQNQENDPRVTSQLSLVTLDEREEQTKGDKAGSKAG